MIYSFYEFITESKDYPLYKGVSSDSLKKMISDKHIIATGLFDSSLRELVTKGKCISATRNKQYAPSVGQYIIVFDTKKLTSSFKVVPFCENPDYYLELMDKGINVDDISKSIRMKDHGKTFWKVKTDTKHFDYGISEELIVADKIELKKYVKKILYIGSYDNNNNHLPTKDRFDYWNKNNYVEYTKTDIIIKKGLDELGIQHNIISK